MSFLIIVSLLGGVALLLGGAELLIRGAGRLASLAGISPLIIGLTIVALGTGAPEMAVGIKSSLAGQAGLALGNVVGSNILNILLILGLSSLLTPLVVNSQLIKFDVPVMIGASGLVMLLAFDGILTRPEGLLLLVLGLAYPIALIWLSRREKASVKTEFAAEFGAKPKPGLLPLLTQVALVAGGLAMLILGARLLVDAASDIATAMGVSELIIGLTVVAIGTSLPELATSILASRRGEREIAVGNAVGSNIINLLVVLGLTIVISPASIPVERSLLKSDLPVMLATAVACLPVFFQGSIIARWEGGLFFLLYLLYLTDTLLSASLNVFHQTYRNTLLIFVLPIIAATLIWTSLKYWHKQRKQDEEAPGGETASR